MNMDKPMSSFIGIIWFIWDEGLVLLKKSSRLTRNSSLARLELQTSITRAWAKPHGFYRAEIEFLPSFDYVQSILFVHLIDLIK